MLRSVFGGLALALSAALILLAGCSKPQTWVYSEVESSAGFMGPARIQALTSASHVQLEIARSSDSAEPLTGHLNFLYQELAEAPSDHPDLIELSITGMQGSETFPCTRLKGGGRLLLSKEATHFLIDQLTSSSTVKLSIEDREVTIETDGFEKQLKRLGKKDKRDWTPSFGFDWN